MLRVPAALPVLFVTVALLAQVTPSVQPTEQPAPEGATLTPTKTDPIAPNSTVKNSTKLVLIKAPKAIYPFEAAQRQLQGEVLVKVLVNENGDVENADVVRGDPILARAAVDAVKKWKFQPYLRNGKAVKVSANIPIDFAFSDKVKDISPPQQANSPADDQVPSDSSPANGSIASNSVPRRVRISQGVSQGLLLHSVTPIYPESARQSRIEGKVLLRAVIGKDGSVRELSVITGPKDLVPAAIGAVQQWRYRPYLLLGQPIEVGTQITVIFTLARH